eukprot:COSAG02_NODE_261_length_26663_cov_210.330899_21_plen_94_part_00
MSLLGYAGRRGRGRGYTFTPFDQQVTAVTNPTEEQACAAVRALDQPRSLTSANRGPSGTDDRERGASVAPTVGTSEAAPVPKLRRSAGQGKQT